MKAIIGLNRRSSSTPGQNTRSPLRSDLVGLPKLRRFSRSRAFSFVATSGGEHRRQAHLLSRSAFFTHFMQRLRRAAHLGGAIDETALPSYEACSPSFDPKPSAPRGARTLGRELCWSSCLSWLLPSSGVGSSPINPRGAVHSSSATALRSCLEGSLACALLRPTREVNP